MGQVDPHGPGDLHELSPHAHQKNPQHPYHPLITLEGGGSLFLDCRFCPILVIESTIIIINSCRYVDRLFALKYCSL